MEFSRLCHSLHQFTSLKMLPPDPSIDTDEARVSLVLRLRVLAEHLTALGALDAASLVNEAAWEIDGWPRHDDPWIWRPTTVHPFREHCLTIYARPGTRIENAAHFDDLLLSTLTDLVRAEAEDPADLIISYISWAGSSLNRGSEPESTARILVDSLHEFPQGVGHIDWDVEAKDTRPMTPGEREQWLERSLLGWLEGF